MKSRTCVTDVLLIRPPPTFLLQTAMAAGIAVQGAFAISDQRLSDLGVPTMSNYASALTHTVGQEFAQVELKPKWAQQFAKAVQLVWRLMMGVFSHLSAVKGNSTKLLDLLRLSN